jgi:dihydrofolate reductase
MKSIAIIAALGAKTRAIGKDNKLLWHIPDDLKRFKALTTSHPVIMGRKTFASIVAVLGKALPGRTNIVITRDLAWHYPEAIIVHSLEKAFAKAKEVEKEEIFIGGGTQIYELALPYVDRLYLTLIDDEKEGDSYFPEYEKEFTKIISNEAREWSGLKYRWLTLERP